MEAACRWTPNVSVSGRFRKRREASARAAATGAFFKKERGPAANSDGARAAQRRDDPDSADAVRDGDARAYSRAPPRRLRRAGRVRGRCVRVHVAGTGEALHAERARRRPRSWRCRGARRAGGPGAARRRAAGGAPGGSGVHSGVHSSILNINIIPGVCPRPAWRWRWSRRLRATGRQHRATTEIQEALDDAALRGADPLTASRAMRRLAR